MLDILASIHLLGAAQGIFLAAALVLRQQNTLANKLLGIWMFMFSCDLVELFLMEKQIYLIYPHLIASTYSFPYLYGPLFYLYTRTLISPHPSFDRRNLLHFLPFVLSYLYFLPSFYLQSGAFKLQFLQNIEEQGEPISLTVSTLLKVAHGFTYITLALFLLKEHSQTIRSSFSNIDRINLNWLRILTACQIVIWGTVLLISLFEFIGMTLPGDMGDALIYLGVAALVYVIGYFGLRQPEIFTHTGKTPTPKSEEEAEKTPAQATAPKSREGKYEKTRLDEEKAQRYLQTLLGHMETQKPFVRSTLTLQELADELSIAGHHLSQVINDRLRQNFFDFVNSYRVKEVQQLLLAPESQHLTILSIAYEAGFNSKSSFNTIFKKQTQMTPSQFRSQAGV
jgi:AraC-like DNA-binding protein